MRISDWSSDVCSSDLFAFERVISARAGDFMFITRRHRSGYLARRVDVTGVDRIHRRPERRDAQAGIAALVRPEDRLPDEAVARAIDPQQGQPGRLQAQRGAVVVV